MTHWPFEVIEKDGSPLIKVQYLGDDKTFSPQEISSMVLTKMKEISEAKLGKTVKKAVVTLVSLFCSSELITVTLILFSQRACLLQRLSASGYQGCWCNCWS